MNWGVGVGSIAGGGFMYFSAIEGSFGSSRYAIHIPCYHSAAMLYTSSFLPSMSASRALLSLHVPFLHSGSRGYLRRRCHYFGLLSVYNASGSSAPTLSITEHLSLTVPESMTRRSIDVVSVEGKSVMLYHVTCTPKVQ